MVYGQTGAGKTHTMSGGAWKNNGLIQKYVLDRIKKRKKKLASGEHWLEVTMNQIYQSEIKDLFFKGFEATPQLSINRDKDLNGHVEVINTTQIKYEEKERRKS